VTRWALVTGLNTGLQVGTAISASWLPRAVSRIAGPAGFFAGLALPLAGAWLLAPWADSIGVPVLVTLSSGAITLAARRWGGARWSSLRVGLMLAVLTLLWTRFAP
jgi:hypothetical protein